MEVLFSSLRHGSRVKESKAGPVDLLHVKANPATTSLSSCHDQPREILQCRQQTR
ncbi:hypothetical protein NQ315_010550 [Exocentrus adspersus]|uniref:Uncharacterized protein n=1 Tax=Exocentrus adspersus TaxID=1586481 RepID=A0AAV8W6Z3_9CUCU|nr:hypothetical protein NQ315_010550 [Exocentrus adspersus]